MQKHASLGNCWSTIAQYLKGRTPMEVKVRQHLYWRLSIRMAEAFTACPACFLCTSLSQPFSASTPTDRHFAGSCMQA